MQGAGNDFVVFDNRQYGFLLNEIIAITPRLCHRRFGVGADGVLVLEPCDEADYRMIYRNADGSDAGMCGNGGRCIARFAVKNGFSEKHSFMVHNQKYEATVNGGDVRIKFPVKPLPGDELSLFECPAVFVNSGTEHVVTWVESDLIHNEPELRRRGREIRNRTDLFPKGTNVNFIPDAESGFQLDMRTYERGVEDLTLACGTGALASAVTHHNRFRKDQSGHFSYEIHCSGGYLHTSFDYERETGTYTNLELKGPASFVFEGSYFV